MLFCWPKIMNVVGVFGLYLGIAMYINFVFDIFNRRKINLDRIGFTAMYSAFFVLSTALSFGATYFGQVSSKIGGRRPLDIVFSLGSSRITVGHSVVRSCVKALSEAAFQAFPIACKWCRFWRRVAACRTPHHSAPSSPRRASWRPPGSAASSGTATPGCWYYGAEKRRSARSVASAAAGATLHAPAVPATSDVGISNFQLSHDPTCSVGNGPHVYLKMRQYICRYV